MTTPDTLTDVLRRVDTVTFDCYGTLIDWRRGLRESLRAMYGAMPDERMSAVLDAYIPLEAQVEAGPFRRYADVLRIVAQRLAERFNLDLSPDRADRLARTLPQWRPFDDSVTALARLRRRYRLGVLSNVDRDLFEGTARQLGDPFDFVITAEDARAYKPEPVHFERMLAAGTDRDRVLHVAQSLYHDGVPAARLGLPFVWINRYEDINDTDVTPLATLPDLQSLADAAGASAV